MWHTRFQRTWTLFRRTLKAGPRADCCWCGKMFNFNCIQNAPIGRDNLCLLCLLQTPVYFNRHPSHWRSTSEVQGLFVVGWRSTVAFIGSIRYVQIFYVSSDCLTRISSVMLPKLDTYNQWCSCFLWCVMIYSKMRLCACHQWWLTCSLKCMTRSYHSTLLFGKVTWPRHHHIAILTPLGMQGGIDVYFSFNVLDTGRVWLAWRLKQSIHRSRFAEDPLEATIMQYLLLIRYCRLELNVSQLAGFKLPRRSRATIILCLVISLLFKPKNHLQLRHSWRTMTLTSVLGHPFRTSLCSADLALGALWVTGLSIAWEAHHWQSAGGLIIIIWFKLIVILFEEIIILLRTILGCRLAHWRVCKGGNDHVALCRRARHDEITTQPR